MLAVTAIGSDVSEVPVGVLDVIALGPRAVLVEVVDAAAALALVSSIQASGLVAEEVVPAAATVLLVGVDPATVRRDLSRLDVRTVPADGPLVVLPVRYDGDDLVDVARAWGCTTDEVIERHSGIEFRAAFCGFAPGFAYLSGLPSTWAVPRLASPRPRVPAGAVALADSWCGVYPQASPGGWRILGRTDHVLWDPDAPRPALLTPGTRVRFEPR